MILSWGGGDRIPTFVNWLREVVLLCILRDPGGVQGGKKKDTVANRTNPRGRRVK